MKRVFVGAAVVCILLATGCGDNKTTLTPGDPADPAYQLFTDQFSGIDQTTGTMTDATLEILGDFFPQKPGGAFRGAASFNYRVEYDQTQGHWIAQANFDDPESGTNVDLTETIQFMVNGVPTQYPTLETLDRAVCSATFTATAPDVESLSGTQTMVIVPTVTPDAVIANVNGNGSLQATVTRSETFPEGTRTCDVSASFTSSIVNVQIMNTQQCPVSGLLSHSGTLTADCTGARAGSVDGQWTVTTRFHPDATASVTVVSGGNSWTTTAACGS